MIPPALDPITIPEKTIHIQKLITWKDGVPVPTTRRILPKDGIRGLAQAAVSLPYTGPDPDEEFTDMTMGEVMMIKMAQDAANGDQSATKELLDRIVGKSKQTTETTSLKLTYQDYLEELARTEAGGAPKSPIAPTEPINITPPPDHLDPDSPLDL